ncbi:MAG: sugar transporter ATP-binding protein [Paenibacillus sp.]|jgi:multiple sugar transport system permease protein|nr:sugar transporter ATP-binding protein [Paenibacillus sp.]
MEQTQISPAFVRMKQINFRMLLLTIVLLLAGVVMVVPFLWMITTSFSSPQDVFRFPIKWIPSPVVLDHHIKVWTGNDSFVIYYLNSLKIAIISSFGAVFLAAFAAYGFSKIEFAGRNLLFIFYLSMMLVPPQILFVPKFLMFDWMGIYNTHWALILPNLFTVYGVFMIRQFFVSIPHEISESAMIDGAGHLRMFFRIMLPLAKPVLATFAIIDFSWHWNDYEHALVFLLDKELFTIPLGLQNFIDVNYIDYNSMMAASFAAVLPMLIIFMVAQKFIIEGVSSSAVKG